jgi:succinate-acetate transporter protein
MAQATETKTAVAVANPAPLGLIAFATTTLVLSAANSNFTESLRAARSRWHSLLVAARNC